MASDRVSRSVKEHSAAHACFERQTEDLTGFVDRMVDVFNRGGKLLLLGSGPFGAVAGLVAAQFLHRLSLERPLLPVIALTHDIVLATSLEGDGKGRQFLARQVQVLAGSGDIVLGFFGLGREEAAGEAMTAARQAGCFTAVFHPGQEEPGTDQADFSFHFGSDSQPRAVEGALFFGHLLCEMVEAELFGI